MEFCHSVLNVIIKLILRICILDISCSILWESLYVERLHATFFAITFETQGFSMLSTYSFYSWICFLRSVREYMLLWTIGHSFIKLDVDLLLNNHFFVCISQFVSMQDWLHRSGDSLRRSFIPKFSLTSL